MTTFPDWRTPVERLCECYGPMTDEQQRLAARYDVTVHADTPRNVMAVILLEAVAPAMEYPLLPPTPVTDRQIEYLTALSKRREWAIEGLRSHRTASAWIEVFLMLRTVAALESLELCRDDLVLVDRTVYDDLAIEREIREVRPETHVVSSISETGKVNFRQTQNRPVYPPPARGAWPDRMSLVARGATWEKLGWDGLTAPRASEQTVES